MTSHKASVSIGWQVIGAFSPVTWLVSEWARSLIGCQQCPLGNSRNQTHTHVAIWNHLMLVSLIAARITRHIYNSLTHAANSQCNINTNSLFCLLLVYVIATSTVISGWEPTCDSACSWRLYSAVSLGHWDHDLLSHSANQSWHWANQYLPDPKKAECQARKQQVSILKSLVWPDQGSNAQGPDSNPWGSDSLIFQHGRRTVYSFSYWANQSLSHSRLSSGKYKCCRSLYGLDQVSPDHRKLAL